MNITSPQSWKAWAKTFQNGVKENAPYVNPFRVVNKGSETEPAEILIYDQIGRDFWTNEGLAAKDFAKILSEIKPGTPLVIGINSPGGSVWDGQAIANALERWDSPVTTRNDGIAASIASVIFVAGKTRKSHENARIMIHRAWGMMVGNATDAVKFAAELQGYDDNIAEHYARHTTLDKAAALAAMDAETYYNAAEAKLAGMVDEVIATGKNQLSAPAAVLAAAPQSLSPAPTTPPANRNHINHNQNKTMPDTNTPAAATPAAPINIDLSPVINAINALGEKLPKTTPDLGAPPAPAARIENLGNPLVEKYNSEFDPVAKAVIAKAHYNDLRKQLMIANSVSGFNQLGQNYDRFDFNNPVIRNANTVDAALANTVLSGEFVTTMRSYIAPWAAFTRRVELSPVSRRQTLEVPLYSSVGSKQQNATNYETGDSVIAPIAVTVAEESKSFHTTRPQSNLGLQLAGLMPTNIRVLAEGIHAKMTALMTNANYGADVVIGAAANFDATDLPAILALGKNYDRCTLLLDGGHLAYLLPTTRESFAFGEPGAFGFDGGIYKNNLWTSAATDICGLVCGPDAIVNAWGMADGLPAGEAISQSTVDVNGIPFTLSVWFSRATREVWGSVQVMHGCAVGDATQAEVLTTQ